MNTTILRAALAGCALLCCAANARPGQSWSDGRYEPARLQIACEVVVLDGKGDPEYWRCMACLGQLCSASWLSDEDQSGHY